MGAERENRPLGGRRSGGARRQSDWSAAPGATLHTARRSGQSRVPPRPAGARGSIARLNSSCSRSSNSCSARLALRTSHAAEPLRSGPALGDRPDKPRLIDKVRDGALSMGISTPDDNSAISEMIFTGERLLIVKGKGIYEVKLADQVDPGRTNIATSNTVQRVLPYGADDSIVAPAAPLDSTTLSNLSDGPCGRFSPRSHFWTVETLVLR